jgi:putrescine:ornithine antiporter
VSDGVYRRNTFVAVVAMVYSTYAIYAPGKDAVLGGTIVLALTYIVFGFLAPRFMKAGAPDRVSAVPGGAAITAAAALLAVLLLAPAQRAHAQVAAAAPTPAPVATLDRIKQSGRIALGYRKDARPFAFVDGAGKPTGYSVALCQLVAERIKTELGLGTLQVEWVEVEAGRHRQALREHRIDLLCGDTETLSSRKEADFSVPIYPGGIGALLRSDAPIQLREALSEAKPQQRPQWRASLTTLLTQQTFAAVAGTNSEAVVTERLKELKLPARYEPVPGFEAGVKSVVDRKVSVFFAERQILEETAKNSPDSDKLIVVDRRFTNTPIAMAMAIGDDGLRLIVDSALSRFYRSGQFRPLYTQWFGKPDASAVSFFTAVALPE